MVTKILRKLFFTQEFFMDFNSSVKEDAFINRSRYVNALIEMKDIYCD